MTTMQPESADALLKAGTAALRAGDRTQARTLLMRAVRADPRNEQAWLYLAGALSDSGQRRDCLERVLQLNPANTTARRGLEALAKQATAGAAQGTRSGGQEPRPPAPQSAPPLASQQPAAPQLTQPLASQQPAAPQLTQPLAQPRVTRQLADAPLATPEAAAPAPAAPAPAVAPAREERFDAYLPPSTPPALAPAPATNPTPATPAAAAAPAASPPPAPWLDDLLAAWPARQPDTATPPARKEDRLILWLAVVLGVLLMLVSASYVALLLAG